MAKFSAHQIIALLSPQTGILEILRAAIVLQAEIESSETQDFYFQKDLPAHRAKLEELKTQYAEAAAFINDNSVDFFWNK